MSQPALKQGLYKYNQSTNTTMKNPTNTKTTTKPKSAYHDTPFSPYFRELDVIDGAKKYSSEFGSIMILSLVEEVGEMARAYLAEHGRKASNLAAQTDETYEQELGDLMLTIIRFARIKNINLDERIRYSLEKIKRRKTKPKTGH